jgi:multiple sugar transport system substrate-binding protein
MKFRRGIVVAAAVAATAIALVGCSSGGTTSPSATPAGPKVTEINYWYWQDDTTDKTIANLALDFKKKTGITVNITANVAQPQFYDKLVNAIAAGNAPDATHLNTNMMGQLINAKVLSPLDKMIAKWSGKNTIPDTMWAYDKSPDGKTTYALPNKFLMFYMFYRTDIFKAEGIAVPKNQYGFDIRGGANGQDQWAAFLTAGGMKFLNGKGDVSFDSAAAKKSNDLYTSMYKYAPPGSINDALPQLIANLTSGTATMIINHLGAAKTLDAALGDKVGVALIPSATGDPKKTTYMGTMNSNAVLASSPKQQAAFDWISFLDSETSQTAITRSSNGYVPVTKQAAKDSEFLANPNIAISLEAAKYSTQAWPNIPGTTAATTKTWQPLFQGALLGKNTNDAVVEGVATSLKTGQ